MNFKPELVFKIHDGETSVFSENNISLCWYLSSRTLCHLGNFLCFFSSTDPFSQNQLFWKILSGIPSESQTVWFRIRPGVQNCLQKTTLGGKELIINEPWHEISNNVVCATSKGSDQPAHMRSLIWAFASRLNIIWVLSYWLNIIWSF